MQIVDPTIKPKSSSPKLKGGEDFDAEPGAEKPSEKWMETQVAKLKLTVKQDTRYGNVLPELNAEQEYERGMPEFDEEVGRYYYKNFLNFRIQYRYYKGNKKRSYLFWAKHVQPGWSLRAIMKEWGRGSVFRVTCPTGWADYVYVGKLDTWFDAWGTGRPGVDILALWRSHGTMKPRRTRDADTG